MALEKGSYAAKERTVHTAAGSVVGDVRSVSGHRNGLQNIESREEQRRQRKLRSEKDPHLLAV